MCRAHKSDHLFMYDLPEINDQPGAVNGSAGEFIRTSANELRALNASTEADFLSIGAYLQELSCQAEAVSKAAQSVVGLVTDERAEKDMERLREIEGLINASFGGSQVELQRSSGSLSRMLGLVETAYRSLSTFKTIVKHLHMLAIATRIEDARVNKDANFDMLSEHVENLSVIIASKAEGILQALAALLETVKQTLPAVLSAKEAINDRTEEMLHSLDAGLSTLFREARLIGADGHSPGCEVGRSLRAYVGNSLLSAVP